MPFIGTASSSFVSGGAAHPGLAMRAGAVIATLGAALYVGNQLDIAFWIVEAQASGTDGSAVVGDRRPVH